MRTRRVKDVAPLLEPGAAGWDAAGFEPVKMMPAPLAMQPTEYIRVKWEGREYGHDPRLHVASVHDGKRWALCARWTGVSPSGIDFPDAIAVALPVRNDPPLIVMGMENAPIQYLRWQSNKPAPRSVIATGIGRSETGPVMEATGAKSRTDGEHWDVVITRPLGGEGDVAPLLAGQATKIGFAVWRGANDERGGIKAFSIDWIELALDA